MILAQMNPPLSSQLAGDLLRAWRSGDAGLMATELQRSLSVSMDVPDVGEEERRLLLHTVAMRMRTLQPSPRVEDPVLRVCARLLGHLVHPE